MHRFRLAIFVVMLTAGPVQADELLPLPPDQPAQTQSSEPNETSVHTGLPQCLRWTDQCVSCTRGENGGPTVCSNIGPACQPAETRCIQSEPPAGQSDGKTP
jgi:hypothetical protein